MLPEGGDPFLTTIVYLEVEDNVGHCLILIKFVKIIYIFYSKFFFNYKTFYHELFSMK